MSKSPGTKEPCWRRDCPRWLFARVVLKLSRSTLPTPPLSIASLIDWHGGEPVTEFFDFWQLCALRRIHQKIGHALI